MIVVDSSVWIANIRQSDTPAVQWLRSINRDVVVVGDLVMLEVLQGARSHPHAERLRLAFEYYGVVPMLDPTIATQAAHNFRRLRSMGITNRKTVDLIIATFCIENEHDLLHQDRDFDAFETHLGLKVFRPS